MWLYCLRSRKSAENKNSNNFKDKKATGLLSSFWIKTPLSKIPLVDPILFYSY